MISRDLNSLTRPLVIPREIISCACSGDMLTQNGLETNCYTRVSADQFLSFGGCGMDPNDFVNMVQGLNNELLPDGE